VVIVGVDEVRGHPAIVGALIDLNGTELRRASVTLETAPSEERLKALAAFLTGGKASAGIDVQLAGDVPGTRAAPALAAPVHAGGRDQPPAGRWGGWKLITGGVALAALGVGGYLLSINLTCATAPPPGTPCTDLYNTAVPGWAAITGGIALAAVTVYLVVRNDRRPPARTTYVVPTAGGALAGVAVRW
jgi:hypothetical protein